MIDDVACVFLGAVDAVVAGNGTLAYVSGGGASAALRTLVWVDRQGRETPIAAAPRTYVYQQIDPDGTRVALYSPDQETRVGRRLLAVDNPSD